LAALFSIRIGSNRPLDCIRTVSILSGLALSASFGVALGVCIYLSIGSWFLSCRGLDREGKPVGFFGGMKVICVFLES